MEVNVEVEARTNDFINKFSKMLKNASYADIITLDETQRKISIMDKRKFELEILPKFYRHGRFTSFVRQLNLYGFKRAKGLGQYCFTHPTLIKGKKFTSILSNKRMRAEQRRQENQSVSEHSQRQENEQSEQVRQPQIERFQHENLSQVPEINTFSPNSFSTIVPLCQQGQTSIYLVHNYIQTPSIQPYYFPEQNMYPQQGTFPYNFGNYEI